jgi:beta-phosphoglucomutase-like phosphatase (HAD superfamily)
VAEIVTLLEARAGAPLPPEWLYDWGMHVALGFAHELETVAGVRAVVTRLAARGIPVCVASQAPRVRVDLALSMTRLAPLFGEHVFTASLVPRPKPFPDLFLLAAARMG